MSDLYLRLVIDDAQVGESLREKGKLLEAALLETVGSLGSQLLAAVQENLSGKVLQNKTGQLFDAVTLQAAQYVDRACKTSVGIDEGQPSWLIGYVQEYGHQAYDIVPIEQFFDIVGLPGKGRLSPHSAEGSIALAEGRLPHALHWVGAEGSVFAAHVSMPASEGHSWLRSALTEMTDQIYAELTETLNRVIAA